MKQSTFGRFSSIQWLMIACAFMVAVVGTAIHPSNAVGQPAGKGSFAGKWNGKFENNKGDKGEGVYEFNESTNGQLKVKVSWDSFEMELTGERLGSDAVRLKGKHADTSYRYIGNLENSVLVLHYTADEGKSGKSYFGVSRLTRQKK